MALPVLDGNQSATTLSSVVTGGEHIVAHSVVSLGATAISNINSAVSGSAVTIPGLARLGNSIASDNTADANLDFVKIGGHQDGQNQVAHIVHVSAGGAMKVDASGSSVTFSQAPVTFGAITGSASILNFPSTQTIAGTVTANADSPSLFSALENYSQNWNDAFPVAIKDVPNGVALPTDLVDSSGNSRFISGTLPISGTVTANLPALNWNTVKIAYGEKTVFNGIYKKGSSGYVNQEGGGTPEYIPVDGFFQGGTIVKLTRGTYPGGQLSFTGTRWYFEADGDVQFYSTTTALDLRVIADWTDSGGAGADVQITPYSVEPVAIPGGVEIAYSGGGEAPSLVTNSNPFPVKVQNSVTIGSLPSGSLTTRFGSVTTANTAQITSAVTNTNRKYLLAQNISAGTVTIGIGFSPTTTQGIQLAAGGGLTFDAFCPTGAVYWLGAVTGANYCLIEG